MKAVVDRIEGNHAVVLFEDRKVNANIPLVALPAGIIEGDWLTVNIQIDKKTTATMYQKNKALLERLKNKNKR